MATSKKKIEKTQDIVVKLTGTDGNAYALLGKVKSAMEKAGFRAEAKTFIDEATKGDYNHLLSICCKYVDVR